MIINNEYTKLTPKTYKLDVYLDGLKAKGQRVISEQDLQEARKHSWMDDTNGYLWCWDCKTHLHRLIMGLPDKIVDHIDRNPWNNTRRNLRLATHTENMHNRSSTNKYGLPVGGLQYSGSKWRVILVKNGHKFNLGNYSNLNDAICARIRGEYEHFGEFSKNYRHLLKRLPRTCIVKWFPEIYSKRNIEFIGHPIQRAHYKNEEVGLYRLVRTQEAGTAM